MNARTTRDALVVFVGRVAFVALWYVALLAVYRGFGSDADGLAQAGLFAVSIACVKIVTGCIIDPVDVALMRSGPGLLGSDAAAAFRLFRAAFWMRLSVALAAAALLLGAAATLGSSVPAGAGLAPLLPFVAAAVLGEMFFRSVLVVLQAQERFLAYVGIEGVLQAARFAGIAAIWAAGTMRLDLVMASYAAAPFVAALAGAMLVPRALFASARTDRRSFGELLHFLKWMVPAMVLATFNERLDVVLVYGFAGPDAAGLYGALLTLALAPDILAGSLGSIIQPRIARMRAEGSYGDTLRRYLRIALPGCGLVLAGAVLLAEPAILLLLGPGYAAGTPVFLWLLAGTLFWLAVVPLPMSLVSILAPRRIALVTATQSAIVVGGGLVLLPMLGALGMAQTICGMRVAIALLLLAMARRCGVAPDAAPPQAQPTVSGP